MTRITKQEAIQELWANGIVTDWLLDENQKTMVTMIEECAASQIVIVFPRQVGKSFGTLAYLTQLCLQKPGTIATFVAPYQSQAKKIAKTTMREILTTCPDYLQPSYKTQDNLFQFQNGSIIELVGNNAGHIEKARGPKAHIIVCDEVGFWVDLDYSIKSVLLPKLNTTKGKLIMTSTPPSSAGHPFQKFYETAKFRNAALIRTIYDCPRYTNEEILKFAEECGGLNSIEFQREYMCLFKTDSSKAVIPEATEELLAEITQEWKRPPYYLTYVSMDIGFKDLTVILFAYHDFRTGKIIVEDEVVLDTPEKLRTDSFAYSIYDKEQQLWGTDDGEHHEPYRRVSDINHILLNDLYLAHNLSIIPTAKDDLDGQINNTRLMVGGGKVIIHPRCKTLLFHLKNAVWKNDKRKEFSRSADAGHYDALSALIYLLRNIDYHKNPYPEKYDLKLEKESFLSPHWKAKTSDIKKTLKEIFTPNREKKKVRMR